MKKMIPYMLNIVLATASTCLVGCNKADMASPDCAALAKGGLTNAEQTELAKKCPRAGAPFKPSPPKNW